MTSIHQALRHQLHSLYQLLERLDNASYRYHSPLLSNASIGQHIRHIIELIQCLEEGYESGLVSYDHRKRDKAIETDRSYAIQAIEHLLTLPVRPDKQILLEGNYLTSDDNAVKVASTYNREIVYNIEHSIHHMALIKVSLKELKMDLVNDEFGVAHATIQYRNLCVQ